MASSGDDLAMSQDLGADAGPLSPWGIDTRPANPTCSAPPRPVDVTNMNIGLQPMFPNMTLSNAMQIYRSKLTPTDPMRWFVMERDGHVLTFVDENASTDGSNGTEKAQVFLDLSGYADQTGEGGLLALAFDPDFANNHIVYVSYTGTSPTAHCPNLLAGDAFCSNIARYTVTQKADGTFTASTETSIFRLVKPYSNHNGGDIFFGPDGYLYASFGDGGNGNDNPQCSGQNRSSPLGKLLRIDPRSVPSGYVIPPDNPFASPTPSPSPSPGPCIDFNYRNTTRTQFCPEIYAWGLRNPFRWSFDSVPPNGAPPGVWIADVGQSSIEEVDFVEKGKNYGWSQKEGTNNFANGCPTGDTNYVPPLVEYAHTTGNQAIIGGFVYRGSAIPALVGAYLFADYGTGNIFVIPDIYNVSATTMNPTPALPQSNVSVVGFSQDENNELYVIMFGGKDTSVYKIVPASPPMEAPNFPQKLSQTGCVDPADPTQPAAGLIPYDVIAPLWSDGADKRRFMALPDGTQIHVGGDGHFELPVGAVLMKEFSLGGTRLETRLLVHHADGDWAGYTYVWDAGGADATLIDGRQQTNVNGQEWTFPSRADCLSCHTVAAGRSLGPDVRQFNHPYQYPDGRNANELATLDHIGLFDAPIGDPSTLTAFSAYGSTDSVELRARSYLHANCAHCHRPGSTGGLVTAIDFRFEETFLEMNICNVAPMAGTLGIANAELLAPGSAATSVISARMHATDTTRMPPIASILVDPTGTSIVDGWITSVSSCP